MKTSERDLGDYKLSSDDIKPNSYIQLGPNSTRVKTGDKSVKTVTI